MVMKNFPHKVKTCVHDLIHISKFNISIQKCLWGLFVYIQENSVI